MLTRAGSRLAGKDGLEGESGNGANDEGGVGDEDTGVEVIAGESAIGS